VNCCDTSRVLETRNVPPSIWRRRTCMECRREWWTEEREANHPPRAEALRKQSAWAAGEGRGARKVVHAAP
jgi:transcriptional regulator NrdR family protein